MTELINLTERVLNNESTMNENTLHLTVDYISYIAKHKNEVVHAVNAILNIYTDLDVKYLTDKLNTYDMDLISSDNIKFCSVYFSNDDVSSIWRTSLFKRHMKEHVHHIDYYLKGEEFPNKNQLVLVVAEFFAMATDKEISPKSLIEDIVKNVTLPDDVSDLMLAYISVIPPYIEE